MICLRVNGVSHEIRSDASTPLIYVLRNELGLTGTKIGCALEQCGACAILVDGESRLSCVVPVAQFEGRNIQTIEDNDPILRRVCAALVAAGAAQCGYCIPGMAIALTALLRSGTECDEQAIRAALQPHLCRCGTHVRILRAARSLSAEAAE